MPLSNLPLALECFATLVWMRVALRVMPRRVLRGVLEQRVGSRPIDTRTVEVFRTVAARSVVAHTCMHRSLALQAILARRGAATRLCIGIGRRPQLFPGHAWLEADGCIVNDDAELVARYEPLIISESALAISYSS